MPHETIYSADLTAGSLKLRESRVVAGLLINQVSEKEFRDVIVTQNILQARTAATAIRLARLLRKRLEGFDSRLWLMVWEGDKVLATQALLASAMKHSRLLFDFMDLVIREEYRLLHIELPTASWSTFLDGCTSRCPGVEKWSESTRRRLKSTVFHILSQAGYLRSTKKPELQKVTILPELVSILNAMGETRLLGCLQLP